MAVKFKGQSRTVSKCQGTGFMSPFWRLEVWRGSQFFFFWKICWPIN